MCRNNDEGVYYMDHEEDTEVEEGLINRNKTMIKSETNKWADIYNERDCPFNLAYMIERDGYWINDSSKGNIYLDDPYTLLSSILEYIGIYNFDDKDCYQVLEFLYKNIDFCYDGNNILDKLTDKMVDDIFFQNNNVSDNLKHRAHLLCEKYVNTILCLL